MNRKLNIEDIENSIEIFGNEFELEFTEEYIKKLQSLDVKNMDENIFNQLKEILNLVLKDDKAYDKIKESYEKEKNKEFGLQTFIRVYEFIFNEYNNELSKINDRIVKINSNREQRRNYNKGNKYRRY